MTMAPVVSNIPPCLCDPTRSFLALKDREEAGCRFTLFLHVTSLWARNLLHSVLVPGRVFLPSDHQYCGTLVPPLLQSEKLYDLVLLSRRKCFLRHDGEKTLNQTQKHRN